LPKGFQTAEFLQDHGLVDMIVSRHRIREVLAQLLGFFARKK
jgi:acetyl-CoA carboxylase carboxyl transferase subunit beta